MKQDKLLAEWFWVDRWMGSSAFLLPIEARGLYREMLSQAWRRGARLPADPEAIRRAVGCTEREWKRSWPKIHHFWIDDGEGFLVNETQVAVYKEARSQRDGAREHARAAARARHKHNSSSAHEPTQASLGDVLADSPPSPSPTKVRVTPSVVRETESRAVARATVAQDENEAFLGTGEPGPKAWSREACDDWIERHGGTAPGGQIGRHLRLLVQKHGWDTVRRAWRAYLAETEAEYANPARFSATFGTWNRGPVAPSPPPPAHESLPLEPQDDEAAEFFGQMREKLKSSVPLHNWATWLRPVEGWQWLDSGAILELAAPSREHAEMLRGFYSSKLRSAAAELGKQLKFKVFVLETKIELHDGSIR